MGSTERPSQLKKIHLQEQYPTLKSYAKYQALEIKTGVREGDVQSQNLSNVFQETPTFHVKGIQIGNKIWKKVTDPN